MDYHKVKLEIKAVNKALRAHPEATRKIYEFINKRFDCIAEERGEGSDLTVLVEDDKPLFSLDAVRFAIELEKEGHTNFQVQCSNAVHGTECIVKHGAGEQVCIHKENIRGSRKTTYKVNKSKRLKHFLSFLKLNKKLFRLNADELDQYFSTEKTIIEFTKFGEDVDISIIDKCDNCGSMNLKNVTGSHGHSINGFLTSEIPLYVECANCGLIMLKYQISERDIHKIYDDYLSEKLLHQVSGITEHLEVSEGHMFYHVSKKLKEILNGRGRVSKAIDLGGKDGIFFTFCDHFSITKKDAIKKVVDYHIDEKSKEHLKCQGICFEEKDIEDICTNEKTTYDLITMFEVVEHLHYDKLLRCLKNIKELMSKESLLIISTPDYDNAASKIFAHIFQAPIQHLYLYRENFLDNLLKQEGFQVEAKIWTMHCAESNGFSSYAKETSTERFEKEFYTFLDKLLQNNDANRYLHNGLQEANLGTEIVYYLMSATSDNNYS